MIEAEAISRLLIIANLAETSVNIVHLSTKKGYEVIQKAKEKGQKVHIESCPQYFLLDDSKYDLEGFESAKYILSPPLRKMEDQLCLWNALKENKLDTIGTDHCSFNYHGHKDRGKSDFSKIPNGIPSVEHRPALMYTYGVGRNIITKEQLCAVLSTNAAKLFGMYPNKGIIREGSLADIVVWDMDYRGIITAKEQVQNVDYTPYEGFKIMGRAEYVLLRGNLAAENGRIIIENSGRYVYRGKSLDTY
jgi:dihydropyrimidinase